MDHIIWWILGTVVWFLTYSWAFWWKYPLKIESLWAKKTNLQFFKFCRSSHLPRTAQALGPACREAALVLPLAMFTLSRGREEGGEWLIWRVGDIGSISRSQHLAGIPPIPFPHRHIRVFVTSHWEKIEHGKLNTHTHRVQHNLKSDLKIKKIEFKYNAKESNAAELGKARELEHCH